MKITYPSQTKYALFAKESIWGTRVDPTLDLGLIITDISNPVTREIFESQGISAVTTQKITTGMVDPSVSLEGAFQHGRILELAFGSVGHADTSVDWTHTFSAQNACTAVTIETGNNLTTDSVLYTTGCLVETMEISVALNETLKISADFKGKTIIGEASGTTAVLSSLPVFPHSFCHISLNGIEASEVQNASIRIVKIVERSGGISSNWFQQGHPVNLKFEFSANLGFDNSQFYNLFMAGTCTAIASGVTVSSADPTGTDFKIHAHNNVTLGSGRREFSITLENCQYSGFTETTSVGSLTFIDLEGSGTLKECFSVDNIADTSW